MLFKKINTISQIMLGETTNINVPNSISFNELWEFKLICTCCNQAFRLKQTDFIYINSLSNRYMNNLIIVNQLGKLLDLKKEVSTNNPEMLYYTLNWNYLGSSTVSYYQCPNCKAQYLMAFHEFIKDERDLSPNEIYIEKVLQVVFDHEEFMEELKKA